MIIYEATKYEFMDDVIADQLVTNIQTNYEAKIGHVNKNEVRSWENSLLHMYKVMSDRDIPDDAGVAIEFRIPYTSKRVDFLISGRDAEQNDQVVVVELKQWEAVEKVTNKEAIVKTRFAHGMAETAHPSYQAWSYAALITDFNENVQEQQIGLQPCAYLHNYRLRDDDPLVDAVYAPYVEAAPVFVQGDAPKLRDFIKRHIKFGDDKDNLYKIEHGRIRPSKSLQDSLTSMLRGNREFIMIDDQKVVYETALALAEEAERQKQVLVVEGGPGTGKSVLAINLLVELTRRHRVCQYVTKNAAPRNVYATKLKGDFRKTHIDNLFKGSGSYIQASENEFDALIVDEAHRLNEKSGMFNHLGEDQTKEILHASKLAVFFIDEHQRVTLKDSGSIAKIEQFAEQHGAVVTKVNLSSQFRCNGSDGYLAWLDDVLQIRETANANFIGKQYDFRVFDDPNELRATIESFNRQTNKSRIVAGYCWNWIKDGKDRSDVHDITIPTYDFGMSWNLGNSATWAIDEASVSEAGCIHTCQGLEFDYVGVIIGDDLFVEEGVVKTDYTKRAKTDKSLSGIKTLAKENKQEAGRVADIIIRNTYRTLMTRGQKGCFVYCTNTELARYLAERFAVVSREMDGREMFGLVAENSTLLN